MVSGLAVGAVVFSVFVYGGCCWFGCTLGFRLFIWWLLADCGLADCLR